MLRLKTTGVLFVALLSLLVLGRASAASCGRLSLSVDGVPQYSCAGLARTADAFGNVWRRTYYWSGLRLSGRLLDPAGGPSVGTTVTVSAGAIGGPAVVVATVATDANGRYEVTVPRGISRMITVTAAGDTMMVEELVAPNVWLKVHARPGAVLVLWGRIMYGTSPPPVVIFQDLVPNLGWYEFKHATVAANGRYRAIYHGSPTTARLTLAIRAETTGTSVLGPGGSSVHYVTVRG